MSAGEPRGRRTIRLAAAAGAVVVMGGAAALFYPAPRTASVAPAQFAPANAPEPDRPFAALPLPRESFFRADPRRVAGHAVFAWYMTCCSTFGGTEAAGTGTAPNPAWPASPQAAAAGIENYRRAITLAQAAGFDGFALDEGAAADRLSAGEKANISAIFEAARQLGTGFRLYFVFDQSKHDAADYRDLVTVYGRHPNYYRRAGAPVVSAYAADQTIGPALLSAAWWRARVLAPLAAPSKLFWAPVSESADKYRCTPPTTIWRTVGGGYARGASAWQIVTAPLGDGLTCQERYAQSVRAAGLAWVGTYAWHYWMGSFTVLPGLARAERNVYSEHSGGLGLARGWGSIIDRQSPAWVTMLTANDYQESYGETVDDYVRYRVHPGNGTARYTPLGWYKSQAGMAELNRYYMQWYRTGVAPTITRDALFYAYLTMPQSYRVPALNRFRATIGDGAGGPGRRMTVQSVETGYAVPGETLDGDGAVITDQIDGTPFGTGTYLIDARRRLALTTLTTRYPALPPVTVMNGEPADAMYITAAVAAVGATFSAEGASRPYDAATVDGAPAHLPVALMPGVHQIRIAPFRPGAPTFTLSRSGTAALSLRGEAIAAAGPVYDYFPATGFAHD